MFAGTEKRKYRRIKKPIVARFQILNEKGDGGIFPGWDMVNVQDLGAGGIRFNYDDTIEADSRLEFKINFPSLEKPIECRGTVLRAQKEPNSSRVRIASVFTDISDAEKMEIEKFAEKLVIKEPWAIE